VRPAAHSALSRLAHAIVWLRYLVLLVVALAFAHAGYATSAHDPTDWVIFEVGARTLTHYHHLSIYGGDPLHLYANNSLIQIGPPPLLMIAAVQWLWSPHTINVLFVVIMTLMGVASIGFLSAAARHLADATEADATEVIRSRTITLLAGLPLAAAWGYESGQFHHLDDATGLFCLAIALWLCASGRSAWLVGVALGVAVASKPWAIVFAPMLLGLPRRERAKAALVLMVTAAGFWAPFVLAAPETIRSLGLLRIVPQNDSVLYLLGLHGHVERWLRPVQFTLGAFAAGWVALRGRWTAAPLAGIAVRVAFDPFGYAYYGLGPVLAALAWDLTRPTSRRLPVWTTWTLFIEFGLRLFASPTICAVGRLVWVISVLAMLLFTRRVTPEPVDEPAHVAPEPAVLTAS
jgi:hypothetical protein